VTKSRSPKNSQPAAKADAEKPKPAPNRRPQQPKKEAPPAEAPREEVKHDVGRKPGNGNRGGPRPYRGRPRYEHDRFEYDHPSQDNRYHPMYMGGKHEFESSDRYYYPPRQVGSRQGLPRNDDYFSPNAPPRYHGFYEGRGRGRGRYQSSLQ